MRKMFIITAAAVLNQGEYNWLFVKNLKFGLFYSKYYTDFSTARLRSILFFKSPSLKILQ